MSAISRSLLEQILQANTAMLALLGKLAGMDGKVHDAPIAATTGECLPKKSKLATRKKTPAKQEPVEMVLPGGLRAVRPVCSCHIPPATRLVQPDLPVISEQKAPACIRPSRIGKYMQAYGEYAIPNVLESAKGYAAYIARYPTGVAACIDSVYRFWKLPHGHSSYVLQDAGWIFCTGRLNRVKRYDLTAKGKKLLRVSRLYGPNSRKFRMMMSKGLAKANAPRRIML